MVFVYSAWGNFCRDLHLHGIHSIPAREVTSMLDHYLVLKHDVETNVKSACKMAMIEAQFGHRGSYYVQAYLLEKPENVELLKKMQQMGHEISYHYDVMDSCRGDIPKAIEEFENNRRLFEKHGFHITTVCQHGNPVVERVDYHSNRDFFRSKDVQSLYPGISDIMVNYKETVPTDYLYFSDAGRRFQLIYDPINNDIVNSEHRNIGYDDLEEVKAHIFRGSCVVSVHPHRWTARAIQNQVRTAFFKIIKCVAKQLIKIPVFKKIMSKYYHLAKKI